MNPVNILDRSQHPISRKQISQSALKVLYRLKSKGYHSFLVGGAIRDLFNERDPRDFDIVTNASIEEIRSLFRNSKTIGKRFPIVHTYFGNDVIEVSSLKGDPELPKYDLLRADALLRDFSVNALFYDINDFKVVDPLGIIEDVKEGRINTIGDPEEKFKEDPIRMVRALKLAAKQKFTMDPALKSMIQKCSHFGTAIGAGRKYEEMTRIFLDEDGPTLLYLCQEHGLIRHIWPAGEPLVDAHDLEFFTEFRTTVPIHSSRGSFTKTTHTHLWMRLFAISSLFDQGEGETLRARFDEFMVPLGIPFKPPILEALDCIDELRQHEPSDPPPLRVSKEARGLLTCYIEHHAPEWRDLPELASAGRQRKPRKKGEHRGGGGRRRRRGRRRSKKSGD